MGSWVQSWLKDYLLRLLMTTSLAFPDKVATSSGPVAILAVVKIFSNSVSKDHGDILIILLMTQIQEKQLRIMTQKYFDPFGCITPKH